MKDSTVPGWVKNGFPIAREKITFPHAMTNETGVSGKAAAVAVQRLADILARQGGADKGSVQKADVFLIF